MKLYKEYSIDEEDKIKLEDLSGNMSEVEIKAKISNIQENING